jgi:hypothetical protein
MRLPYRSAFDTEPRRVRVTPDDPDGLPERAPRTRRPHGDTKVARVRRLIEETTLTYAEIERRTGVGRASICRWTRDGGWQRPVFAPRATDTVPRARASARLRRRTLAARLDALAERYVRALEADPGVDLETLAAALELAKMAKLAARPKKRRQRASGMGANSPPFVPAQEREATRESYPPLVPAHKRGAAREAYPPLVPAQKRGARLAQEAGTQARQTHEPAAGESAADILKRLIAEGVRLDRAPKEAVQDFIDSHRPPEDGRLLRPRGARSQRAAAHRRMFDWGRE